MNRVLQRLLNDESMEGESMSFPWLWIFFGMFFWMLAMRPRRRWACQGRGFSDERRGFDDETRGPLDRPLRRPRRADLESELARRDALIAKLEERVRVLERIATDDSARLRAEIDALRDPPASSG